MTVRQWTVDESTARVPPDTTVYAVADIHGCVEPLGEIHQAIRADAAGRSTRRKLVIYLGDYVSRGPRSKQALDLLTSDPLPGFETVRLRGNHEDFLHCALAGDRVAVRNWLTYGGLDALASYGIDGGSEPVTEPERLESLWRTFLDILPPAHRAWISGTAISHREGDYWFVHGGVRPGVPLDRQTPQDMIWIRQVFLRSDDDFGAVVVHGHTTMREPIIKSNRISIDTGAYKTGRLTCLVLEGAGRSFMQTEP